MKITVEQATDILIRANKIRNELNDKIYSINSLHVKGHIDEAVRELNVFINIGMDLKRYEIVRVLHRLERYYVLVQGIAAEAHTRNSSQKVKASCLKFGNEVEEARKPVFNIVHSFLYEPAGEAK